MYSGLACYLGQSSQEHVIAASRLHTGGTDIAPHTSGSSRGYFFCGFSTLIVIASPQPP